MKQATRTDSTSSLFQNRRLREGLFILCCATALFLIVSLLSYTQADPGWSRISSEKSVQNLGGEVGAWFADVLLYLFGFAAFIFPMGIGYHGWARFLRSPEKEKIKFTLWHYLGFALILLSGCGLISLHLPFESAHLPYQTGGILGALVGEGLAAIFNAWGSTLILISLLLSGVTFFTGLSWVKIIDGLGKYCLSLCKRSPAAFKQWLEKRRLQTLPPASANQGLDLLNLSPTEKNTSPKKANDLIKLKPALMKPQALEPPALDTIKIARLDKPRKLSPSKPGLNDLPPIDLLDPAEPVKHPTYTQATLEEMSRRVEEKLLDFGVDVKVVAAHPGPVVTRFELQLAPGIKVSRISSLNKDLARSLSVLSVRVVEVIPGKSYVGLELPNPHREIVRLSEVFHSQQYEQAKSPLSLALGKDIAGHPAVVDLAKMPHLLVAGTTGSGKSVGLNGMLLSMLYKAKPEDVRLIMIDPKMLELSIYDDIPHLLTPVVTDMKEAANALRWCIAEMDRRYRIMSHLGVRNLAGYNHKIKEAQDKNIPIPDPFVPPSEDNPIHLQTLPYVVVVIDEFADMMLVVGKKVEDLIARLAQKARAAGIHLILATQRPSVDVITGLIKANIPTRIAFQVSSKIDSRTIIDQQGAEQLLGYGDMLYLAPGTGVPVRIHGAFVADHEVHSVVNYLKQQGKPNYLEEVVLDTNGKEGNTANLDGTENNEMDPLYDQAVQIVTETRRASISSVQRRLKIGYNRAARMLEDMEKAGIVSEMQHNGNREVLVNAPPILDESY